MIAAAHAHAWTRSAVLLLFLLLNRSTFSNRPSFRQRFLIVVQKALLQAVPLFAPF
jgi:hypothetical protein